MTVGQVQLRESERDAGPREGYQFPRLGRGWPGEAAPAVEELHPVHGRYSVRAGLCRRGEDGGGQDGTGQDGQVAGQRGSPYSYPGQQTGPAGSARTAGVGKTAGTPRARRRFDDALVARPAGLRHHGRRPARGHRSAVRDDTEEAETGEAMQEKD